MSTSKLIFLEINLLGFVKENIMPFRNFLKSISMNEKYLIEELQEVAIPCSYFIYYRRNEIWNESDFISCE